MKAPLRHLANCVPPHDKAWTGIHHALPGIIIFTASKGLPGVGFTRHEWNATKRMRSSANGQDTHVALQSRETDYAILKSDKG